VRFYEPGVGRFGQVDPVETVNYYPYVGGSPLLLTDESGLLPTFLGCTRNQIAQLVRQINDILNNRLNCISGGRRLRNCIENRLRNGYIRCGAQPGDPPCSGCGYTDLPTPREHIHVCADAFNSSLCGCLGRTIIHEFAHSCTQHSAGIQIEPPEGYQCEWDCYGRGNPPCPR